MASGPEDNVAEYYQQQVEMLEGFNEMDALAERGFIPGMSKVLFCLMFYLSVDKISVVNLLFNWYIRKILLQEEQEKLAKSETFAIRISNVANMVLFAAKVYASFRSGSLAIIASTLDSLLDLLSGFILWFTAFSMQTPNPYQYPIGKRRMQPLVRVCTIILHANTSILHLMLMQMDSAYDVFYGYPYKLCCLCKPFVSCYSI